MSHCEHLAFFCGRRRSARNLALLWEGTECQLCLIYCVRWLALGLWTTPELVSLTQKPVLGEADGWSQLLATKKSPFADLSCYSKGWPGRLQEAPSSTGWAHALVLKLLPVLMRLQPWGEPLFFSPLLITEEWVVNPLSGTENGFLPIFPSLLPGQTARRYGPKFGQQPGQYLGALQSEHILIFSLFIAGLKAESCHNSLQAGLILTILLSQLLQIWDDRYV